MLKKDSWIYAMIGLAVICLTLPVPILAQEALAQAPEQEASAQVFKQEELDQLLAPIALYPDNVITLVLIASTYPLEVVQAERWMKENKNLKGDARKAALDKQSWDDSVKALVPFPDVLNMMSEKLDWTQKLGDAFLSQQKEVMDTVQQLRRKAVEAGNLKDSKEQEVKKEGDIIIIQPADPQVVYVPVYNPVVVYGPWPYPAYPPYPIYVYPPPVAVPFSFTIGVAVGAAWHGAYYHNHWHGGTVVVTRPPRPMPPGGRPGGPSSPGRPSTPPSPGGGRPEQWQHNPEHRQGVAYRDAATRDKYSPTNRAAVDNRMNYRGYDRTGTGAGVANRAENRQPAQGQYSIPDRSGSGVSSRDNAFGGMDRGGQVNRESARGHQSLSSAQSRGGGYSRPSGGGGMSRGGGGRRGR
jgi:uncharacterized membrane protein YgcG